MQLAFKSVCQIFSIMFLYLENYNIWQPFGPRGTGCQNFYWICFLQYSVYEPFSTLRLAVGLRIVVFLVLLPEEKGFF